MMPIIRPLIIAPTPMTEYQKEKEAALKLKASFRFRHLVKRRLAFMLAGLKREERKRRPIAPTSVSLPRL